jgi:transcriptional regulator with XRE-family HTH domain
MQVRDREALKRWRLRRDLTQRQLGFLVGTSQTTIYLLESGGMRTLSEKLALQLARRLDVPWEDIFEAKEASRMSIVTTDARSTGAA